MVIQAWIRSREPDPNLDPSSASFERLFTEIAPPWPPNHLPTDAQLFAFATDVLDDWYSDDWKYDSKTNQFVSSESLDPVFFYEIKLS